MLRTLALVVALLVALAAASTRAAEPLRWKFEEGQDIGYRMTQETNMSMNSGPAGALEFSTWQAVNIIWNIEEVAPDGSAKIRQKITRMQMKTEAPGGQSWQFDSDSDEPPQGFAATLAPVFNALVGSDYVVTMTPRGEITDVQTPEKLVEALKTMPGAAATGASEEMIQKMAKHSALKLPEEPLEKGETWSTSVAMNAPVLGEQTIKTTYKYIGSRDVEGQTMEVFEPSISLSADEDKEDNEDAAAGQVQAKFTGTESSGEVLFNRDEGQLASSELAQKMDMEFTVNGQAVVGTMNQTVKLESVDPKELQGEGDDVQEAQSGAEAQIPAGAQ